MDRRLEKVCDEADAVKCHGRDLGGATWVSLCRQNHGDNGEEAPIRAVGTGGLTEEESHICREGREMLPRTLSEKMHALWSHQWGESKEVPAQCRWQQPKPEFIPQHKT